MTHESELTDAISRRDFLKTFPKRLLRGLREIRASQSLEKQAPERGKARLDVTRCLAWGGLSCQHCYLGCPLRDQALMMVDAKPVLRAESCNGCGVCVDACRTVNDPPALVCA